MKKEQKNTVIITGGELFNKGAQAMTFIAVDEMKKRFPGCKCVLVSTIDAKRPKKERQQYDFTITRKMGRKELLMLSIPPMRPLLKNRTLLRHYQNAFLQLDISGYALGSNWSSNHCLDYLLNIRAANSFHVPVYLMPQSFGPFAFKGKKGKLIEHLIRRELPRVKKIFCREQEGIDLLGETYRIFNTERSEDLVLQNAGVDPENIYRTVPEQREFAVPAGSVAIIPNCRNNQFGDRAQLAGVYQKVIDELQSLGRKVYLLYHSSEDRDLCEAIRDSRKDAEDVDFLDEELSCLAFDAAVSGFDYIIASRFHAIVHAYRNGVPAVILGWATKYHDLAVRFGQEQYQSDVRGGLEADAILEMVRRMDRECRTESGRIRAAMEEIRKDNVFDKIQP